MPQNKKRRRKREDKFEPRILIKDCQVKSLSKMKKMCALLDELEKEIGIHEVLIRFDGMFICPDIDLTKLNETPMENLVRKIFERK